MNWRGSVEKRLVLAGAVAIVVAVSACESSGPGAERLLGPESAAVLARSPEQQARHEQMKQRLKQEKERIKRAKESSRAQEKALREEWKAWKKQWDAERKRAKKEGRLASVDLLRCEPQGYEADAQLIGPDGGEIHVGPHKLVVPKGALDEEVVITGEAPVSDLVGVEFEPHGLQFQRSPTLELSYKHCLLPQDASANEVVYVDDGDRILEILRSADKKGQDEVHARIDHFSKYVLAVP